MIIGDLSLFGVRFDFLSKEESSRGRLGLIDIYIKWKQIGSSYSNIEPLDIELHRVSHFLASESYFLGIEMERRNNNEILDFLVDITFPEDATKGEDNNFNYVLLANYLLDSEFYLFKYKNYQKGVTLLGGKKGDAISVDLDNKYIDDFLCEFRQVFNSQVRFS